MARQTQVMLLLILATAPKALADVVNPETADDFDQIVKEAEECSTCCPNGWVRYERRCYKYQATYMDWASAEKHCLDLNAHLVSIHSENEHQWVKALIRTHDPRENPTWIGLISCQKRNNFFWSDGTKLTFTKWNPNEPNFDRGECCVHIDWSDSKNWNDIPCHYSYPFVCAKIIN
ncbi:lactose-binding lectin l-2-like isoform X1 [Ictalurus punctatus]|uniref:Lactose-binding lectin l-2-like isoform X1 n=1 Tax=Ictalurus punctatus TaxID=7998 RepID=A0A9F7RLL4_ICTPU|nr:lactose-binding lectin l-2-like isoform X1 [Ictalurus punctatus]